LLVELEDRGDLGDGQELVDVGKTAFGGHHPPTVWRQRGASDARSCKPPNTANICSYGIGSTCRPTPEAAVANSQTTATQTRAIAAEIPDPW
jgi:hypothetical protein